MFGYIGETYGPSAVTQSQLRGVKCDWIMTLPGAFPESGAPPTCTGRCFSWVEILLGTFRFFETPYLMALGLWNTSSNVGVLYVPFANEFYKLKSGNIVGYESLPNRGIIASSPR